VNSTAATSFSQDATTSYSSRNDAMEGFRDSQAHQDVEEILGGSIA
jgi:hypothetical protein